MVTVQQVFDMAIHLMDEQSETSGATGTIDTLEYKFRTISILNAVMPSLWIYSDNCDYSGAGRPCPPRLLVEDYADPDFQQFLPLDDSLCLGVLPYALASHLLSSENEELSRWFLERYAMAVGELRDSIPGSFQPIGMPYGAF